MQTGDLLYDPSPADLARARTTAFRTWVERREDISLPDYPALWAWSIANIARFWEAVWSFFDVLGDRGEGPTISGSVMPDIHWFQGARLNFAENALRRQDDAPAIIAVSQTRERRELTWSELRSEVARMRQVLLRLGVTHGDRVAGYLPNIPETTIAFLACASIGAIWSSCAPEFGVRSVLDRFGQIEPKVLLVVDGYRYGDKVIDRSAEVADLIAGLPSVEATVAIPYLDPAVDLAGTVRLDALAAAVDQIEPDPILSFDRVPFEHPLFVIYSSGTSGLPKPIVHGHGGIVIEHLKSLGLQQDLDQDDRYFWFSTTGWVMWNILTSGLLTGACIVLFDGNLAYPDLLELWRLAERERITHFGVSAGFLLSCRRAGLEPGGSLDLESLRTIGSTGSPLPVEGYAWVYDAVSPAIQLASGSGGSDVASGFVGGSPIVPTWAGEISCAALGVDVVAFNDLAQPVVGEQGELVIRQPMPSMPVCFWGDGDGSRLRAAYFEHFPGVWRHGDWITFTDRGSCIISGRSDATLNRGGVRLGTGEFYAVTEEMPEVRDSLVVYLDPSGDGTGELLLFVALEQGLSLTEELAAGIRRQLRTQLSPRHIPDGIIEVPAIPRTLTGKKLELPVKNILLGTDVDAVASRGALADPEALTPFESIARSRSTGSTGSATAQ